MEPRRRDKRQLDILPACLRHSRLHKLQLVQVALAALALGPAELAPRNDTIARHDLALLLNQTDHVRVVQAEHARLGFLQGDRAVEFVPHVTPKSLAVVLARPHGAETQVPLELDNLGDGLLLECGEAQLFGRLALAFGLAGVEEGLRAQQGAHVLCAERRSHFGLIAVAGLW